MIPLRTLYLLCASVCLTACSTAIHSRRILPDETSVPKGIVYHLPATAIEASMSFVPTACELSNNTTQIDYAIDNAVVKHAFVPDASQQYVFDYTKLNSKLKLTTANVQMYGSGGIKSINTEIDDRTGEVLAALGGTALNLVKAAAFTPVIGVSSSPTNACPAVIVRQLNALDKLRNKLPVTRAHDITLQEKLDEIDEAKAALASAKAKLAAAPTDAALKKDAEQKAAQLAQLEAAVKDAKFGMPALQKELAQMLKLLTGSSRVLFVPTVEKRCDTVKITGAYYFSRFRDLVKPDAKPNPDENAKPKELDELDRFIDLFGPDNAVFSASVCVTTANGDARTASQKLETASGDGKPPPGGIVYRHPMLALVTVSQSGSDIADFTGERWISMPQYGTLASLDLHNGPFDKNTLKLAFAPDGALASLDFIAQSSAERGALAAQNLSSTYLDIVTARENAKLARTKATDEQEKKKRTDEIAQYEDQLKLLNAQDAIKAKGVGKDPIQAQIDATALETALLNKQIERETARQELETLKAAAP